MERNELIKKLAAMRNAIEDYLDNLSLDEAEREEKPAKEKKGDK